VIWDGNATRLQNIEFQERKKHYYFPILTFNMIMVFSRGCVHQEILCEPSDIYLFLYWLLTLRKCIYKPKFDVAWVAASVHDKVLLWEWKGGVAVANPSKLESTDESQDTEKPRGKMIMIFLVASVILVIAMLVKHYGRLAIVLTSS
jgi:hypothetical protein